MIQHPAPANGTPLRHDGGNASHGPDASVRPLLLTIGTTLTLAISLVIAAAARIDVSALDLGTRLVA